MAGPNAITGPAHERLWALDPVRGLLAIWVFAYHAEMISGWYAGPLPAGGGAVDLFMVLSGFLMTWNFRQRERAAPLGRVSTILEFYARRYFRVAPTYFLLLAVALVGSQALAGWSAAIQSGLPAPHGLPPQVPATSAVSVLSHLSFIFGLFPQLAANDALPDWSLSLEMQFYATVPFLVLLSRRVGWAPIALLCLAAQLLAVHFSGVYSGSTAVGHWPQPAALPFKIGMFLVGCLAAEIAAGERKWRMIALFTAVLLLSARNKLVGLGCVSILLLTLDTPALRGPLGMIRPLLNSAPLRFLGRISYGVYLVHMLLLVPVAAALVSMPGYVTMSPGPRALLLFAISASATIPCAYLIHITTERPGITLGSRVVKWLRSGLPAARALEPV